MNRTEVKNKLGFTLVELLVALAVLSIVSVLILTIFTRTLRGGNKALIIESIKQNGQQVMETIDKTIRGAQRVICPQDTGTTVVVVKDGIYTKYRFVAQTSSNNGYIQQEDFSLPLSPPPGSDPNLYIKNFESTLCVDPFTNPQAITDTNPISGASIINGSFTRLKTAGFKDQIAIKFSIRPAEGASQAIADQIEPVSFQTTISLR